MAGCTSNNSQRQINLNPSSEKEITFRKFLKHFKVLTLPYSYKSASQFTNESSYYAVPDKSPDTLFLPHFSICYKMLPDTTNFFGLLSFIIGDGFAPVLTTYDKRGNKISNQQIDVAKCDGGGPCYTCSEYTYIYKDVSIFSIDTFYHYSCDSIYKISDSVPRVSVISITGKIYSDGRIVLSSENSRDLK
jgi:hypothetical protein